MADETELWGDAHVSYPDWRGSVVLEEDNGGDNDLYELVGLDPDAWLIVGLNLHEAEALVKLHVLAIAAESIPEGLNIIGRIADDQGGELPVTSFEVHVSDPWAVLHAVTHRLDIRLRRRSTVGVPIRISSFGDLPLQD